MHNMGILLDVKCKNYILNVQNRYWIYKHKYLDVIYVRYKNHYECANKFPHVQKKFYGCTFRFLIYKI